MDRIQTNPRNFGALAVRSVAAVIQKNPIKISLNFFGLFLLFFATGFTPSPEDYARGADLAPSSSALAAEREAQFDMEDARQAYHASRGWFWSCSTPACLQNRAAFESAERLWVIQRNSIADANSQSRQAVGLFSADAVDETRSLFWRTFNGGARYAQRMTMWDVFFVGMRSMGRDESLASFIIEMIFRYVLHSFSQTRLFAPTVCE